MTLVLYFQGHFWHSLISGIGRVVTHITKTIWVDSKLDPLHVCDLKDFQGQISKTTFVVKPTVTLTFDRPWHWTRIDKVKFSKSYISATGGSLDLERKGYESDTILDPLCQLELWPQLYLDNEYLDFCGKIYNFVEWMVRLIWKRDINRRTLSMTLTLDFENNCIWEITSDITLVHGKQFLSFICYIRWW